MSIHWYTQPPGYLVIKDPVSLPQSQTSTLFTVSGGMVQVNYIIGLVTTAIGAVTGFSLGNTPTGGSAAPASIMTAGTVPASKGIGMLVAPTFASGVAGAGVAANVLTMVTANNPFMVPAGVITWTASNSVTGAMVWYMNYLPLDVNSYVS